MKLHPPVGRVAESNLVLEAVLLRKTSLKGEDFTLERVGEGGRGRKEGGGGGGDSIICVELVPTLSPTLLVIGGDGEGDLISSLFIDHRFDFNIPSS